MNTLSAIGFYMIGELPVVAYGGILALLCLLFTALISILNIKFGIYFINIKWHSRMAIISIVLALLHGILAMLIFFR